MLSLKEDVLLRHRTLLFLEEEIYLLDLKALSVHHTDEDMINLKNQSVSLIKRYANEYNEYLKKLSELNEYNNFMPPLVEENMGENDSEQWKDPPCEGFEDDDEGFDEGKW